MEMEFLRKLFLQTKAHLQGLTLSQRLAVGACAALIVVSLFWLTSWATESDMVPLFDQGITAEELAPIRQQLDADGVKYTVSGDRVLVPSSSVLRLQAKLAQADSLPKDISVTFDKLIANSSPWFSRDEQDWRRNVALANELSLRLRQFSGVHDARVFIDKNTRRTIGPASTTPTASIQVTMQPGRDLDKNQVKAMAYFVSRAVAGLEIHNVQVTDFTSGRTYSVPKPEEGLSFDDLEDRQKKENYFASQIRELLDPIPGLRVAVRAELDARAMTTTDLKHGKPAMTKERSKNSESVEGKQGNEPGVVPNSGSPNVATGGGSRMQETETETAYNAEQDVTKTSFDTPRHRLVSLAASVNIPRSFLAGIYKQANSGKEPTDDELDAANSTKSALAKIKSQVETLMPKAEDTASQVAVTWFHDNASLVLGGTGGGASEPAKAFSGENMMQLVQMYGGKAGMGVLALMSLVMMLMMVRRVGEGPVLPGEEPPEPLSAAKRKKKATDEVEELEVSNAPVGEAEVTEHLLVGREVDESTLRSQKLVEQVAELVKEDPTMAVGVLQRWIDVEKQ
jgi:flagellar biosynthesis/type III secretory pathway M-ring protein FliF/YscJ